MFDERVLAITEDIMFKWRLLVEDGRKAGHTISQPDLIIAATALHHGLTVVTRLLHQKLPTNSKTRTPCKNLDFCTFEVAKVFTHPKCLRKIVHLDDPTGYGTLGDL
jgi:hypothetical protein